MSLEPLSAIIIFHLEPCLVSVTYNRALDELLLILSFPCNQELLRPAKELTLLFQVVISIIAHEFKPQPIPALLLQEKGKKLQR